MEWKLNRWFTPKVIKERLKKIGFEESLIYYPKPDLSEALPRIWIPIETPEAIEFLTKNSFEYINDRFFLRLSRHIRRFFWKLYPKLFASYPILFSLRLKQITICSISRKPGEKLSINNVAEIQIKSLKAYSSSNNQLDNVQSAPRNKRKEVSDKQSERLSVLMYSNNSSIYCSIALIVFNRQNYDPIFVIKVSRNKESSALPQESKVLKEINERYKMIDGVPKLIHIDRIGECYVNVQTFISGVPLSFVLNKKNFRELAELTTSWLVNFAKITKSKIPEDWREKFVYSVLLDLDSSIGTLLIPNFISQSVNLLSHFEIPCLVCEHRDFKPNNILVDSEKKLGVIDWENCRMYGIPALDLIFFLTRASAILQGNNLDTPKSLSYRDSYHQMLDSNTFTGKIFQDCMNYYASELDIPRSQIPYLRLMTWIVHYYLNMCSDQKLTIAPQSQESYINYWALTLWREELSISGISE